MIDDPLSTGDRISLVTSIFSDYNETKVVECLSGNDAQTFINVIDEVSLDALSPAKNGIECTS